MAAEIVLDALNTLESTMRKLPPLRPDRLLGEQVVREGLGDRPGADDPLRAERAGHRRVEDVELVVGDVGKGAFGHVEVLGENLPRRMRQPVRELKRRVRVEVAVVVDEQHLAAVVGEALDRVRDAGREVPDVTLAHVVLEGAQLRVDGGDPRPTGDHVGPLGLSVPVQLADRAGLEPHVDGGDLGGDGQLADRRLPGPAAFAQASVAVGEGPPEVGQRTVVGRRGRNQIRRLGLASGVRRSKDRRALPVVDWLGRSRDFGNFGVGTSFDAFSKSRRCSLRCRISGIIDSPPFHKQRGDPPRRFN
jgi:hypothetical protein